MVEEIRHPEDRLEHPTVRYEKSDANFRWIFIILLGSAVFAALVESVILEFFYRSRDYQAEIKKSPYPLAPGPSNALPREPRLEQVDRLAGVETPNVHDREAAHLAVLNSYGAAADKGFVHIPIDRAMELIVKNKTLQARPAPAADQTRRSSGLVDSGEPNSGRLFQGGPK